MKRTIRGLILFIVLAIAWVVASRNANPLFLPKPEKVWASAVELVHNGMMWKSMLYSFLRITTATLLSAIISVPLGLLVVNYKVADDIITPITSVMRFIPVTVFYPLLIMWLGIDETMKVTFLFVATFFYFLPSVILSIRETSSDLVDTARTMGMSHFQLMYDVYLPHSLPSLCQGFLMMYGIGWTYVIIVEVTNAKFGLGFLMNIGSARGRTDLVFAGIFTILAISWVFDYLGRKLIKKSFKWKFAREVGE